MCHHHDPRTDQCRHGIQIRSQDGRNIGQQNVAGHATANPGHHAEQGGHDRVQAVFEGLVRAGDREEGQPRSVGHRHRVPLLPDRGGEAERDDSGKERHTQITPVIDRRRRSGANDDITNKASAVCRRKREHQDAEQIQPAPDASHRAAQGEHEGAGKIQQELKRRQRHVCGNHPMKLMSVDDQGALRGNWGG